MQNVHGISPGRIANIAAFAIDQPEDTAINEFTVGPANQPGKDGGGCSIDLQTVCQSSGG